MIDKKDDIMFGKVTFSDVLKDIYENSTHKKKQIDILINELRPLIKEASQALILVPLIKEYLEVGVKNDEQLVKMAGVWQKFISTNEKIHDTEGVLTEEEKQSLRDLAKSEAEKSLEQISKFKSSVVDTMFDDLNNKTNKIKMINDKNIESGDKTI